jgi:predicted HD superfamily hydrolase involved in NAD metabolism
MISDMDNKLRQILDKNRYLHSLGVMDTAVKLAKKYNEDTDKASIAGLIHDCAKGLDNEALLKIAGDCGIEISYVHQRQPELLHGPVGACIAEKEFSVRDKEILHAIKYHTTGCENMSMLDKIIYIADYIEPGRNFPGVNLLREETFTDINKGLLLALDNTIRYVIDRRQLIDDMTIRARNYLLCSENP